MTAMQQTDGTRQWVVNGPDGQQLAESAEVFDTAGWAAATTARAGGPMG
jgi:hypothetical protein